MNATNRWPSIRRYAAALLALATVALVAPSAARAGCNNHIAPGADPFAGAIVAGLEIFGDAASATTDRADAPEKRRSPCSGMSCSQAPSLPMVPASNGSVRIDQWGCDLTPPRLPEPEPFATLADEETGAPVHTGSSLDRPPRVFPPLLS